MTIEKFTFNEFQENTYVIYDQTKECIIIDPGCNNKKEEEKLLNFIKNKKLKPKKLINTHCHIDHVFGNNFKRDSYYDYETICTLGDLDYNGNINVLDVVSMINVIVNNEISDELLCLCDFNFDGMINIQDIILLIDYIFNENN